LSSIFALYQTKHGGNLAESFSAEFRLKRASLDCLNGEGALESRSDLALPRDHVHMLLSIPPKYAVSEVVGFMKGKSAIHLARTYGEHK
jgi:hypothetical protein